MKIKKVLITIPAYNEEKTLGFLLQDIKNVMNRTKYNYSILVVDDGSRDQTRRVAQNHSAKVISHQRNLGLAEAFRTEMRESFKLNSDVIVHIDADNQYHASDIPSLIREVENGYDLVLGSRFRGTIEHMPWLKRLGNKAFSRVISNITGLRITDAQTGFRAFTKEVAKIQMSSTHTYTQEQIIRAEREKFRIKEVPVDFARRGGNTKSRLISNPFEYAMKAWLNILRILRDYQPLKIFGTIGLLFIIIGVIISVWLIIIFLRRGFIGHPNIVIIMVLVISIGVQIWLFGFLADMFRK